MGCVHRMAIALARRDGAGDGLLQHERCGHRQHGLHLRQVDMPPLPRRLPGKQREQDRRATIEAADRVAIGV
ncbi:hypothetical protein D3C72_1354090 [compost metagenome]